MAANYYKYNATMNDRTYFTSVIVNSAGKAKRYFSNVESEIYFGDKEMDDIYQFEFGIEEKVLPIYGYNCYYATELVSGQRIVQGQFVVNYTDTMLIQNTLSGIEDSVYSEVVDEEYFPGGDLHHAIYNKSFDIMIGYGYYDLKDMETYNATSQTIIGAKITGMNKVMDTSGQPILEVFNFVAKDFIEENITNASTGNDSEESKKDNEDKNTPSFVISYVCSDEYDAQTQKKNEEYVKKNKNCEHFIHNIAYNEGYITMMVHEGKDKELTFLSGSIEIKEKVSKDVTFPVFKFDTISKSSMSIGLDSKYYTLLDKKQKEYGSQLKCTVKYVVKLKVNDSTKQYTVAYEDAILHL